MTDPTSDEKSSPDNSITELGLRASARNALLGAGISTVSGVLATLAGGDEALTNLKGFGPKSLADLKKRLRERGFVLPGEAAPPAEVVETVQEEEMVAAAGAVAVAAVPEAEAPEEAPAIATSLPIYQSTNLAVPEAEATPSFGQRLGATLARVRERVNIRALALIVVGVLLIAAPLLPPISLLERLGIVGYTTLDAENSSVSHADGLTLSVDPEAFGDKLRVRLESVPRLEFLEGSAGSALRQAVEALPDHLAVKSSFYEIQVRGDAPQPVTLDVVLPNAAEPWETLDLYTWTGEAWEWVGSELHAEVAEHELLRIQTTGVPANLVVVQAGPITLTVSASLWPGDGPVTAADADVLDEVNPTGLFLGTNGGFVGDPDGLLQPDAGATYVVLPTLRNWAPGATVNRGLLSDVLTMPEIQEAHINNIVQLCTEKGFAGVDVDYRGVAPNDRDAYTAFINALASALHTAGLRLSIVVERPMPTNGGWDTGGYDWAALGAAADALKFSLPEDPSAYVEGGEAQQLLDWATAQAPRYKLRLLVSSFSAEQSSDEINYISLEQALTPFGEAMALSDVSQVEPGSEVKFGLTSQLLSITPQEAAGTYRLQYEAGDGQVHTVWLGTAANLSARLNWASRYHLGGIAVADMLAPGNAEGIVDVVTAYANQRAAATPSTDQEMEIVWTVAGADVVIDQQHSPLTEPGYTWMAPGVPGTYTVGATVAGFDHGSVAVTVARPTPVPTPTPTPEVTATVEMTPTGGMTATVAATEELTSTTLDASYVADVTIPDNTQLDNEAEFVKTWRVRNSSDVAWPQDTVLAFSSDAQMGAPESVEVGAVEPGDTVEVSVEMKAPAEPGRYTGVWRMKTADGFFGTNLSVVIQAGEVAEAPPPALGPVSAGPFELGGHVRDTGMPYADKMHYSGMNWTKVQVHYGQDASGLVAAAHAKGFKIQLSALGSPDMVTRGGFEQDYANWVAGLAAAGADAIEIWNEPNIDREWQIGHISPQAYTNLLCKSYSAIKAANAGTAVISGAPAPTGWFGGCGPNGCDDLPFLQGMYNAGAANCMDYIGAHHNSGATSPSARSGHPADPGSTHHSWFFLPQTELYYNTFGRARKLFYTEMGYASQEGLPTFSDQFSWARGTNNAQQAAWLAEAVQLSVNTGMVRCIIVWNIDFVRYGDDPQDGFAIIRPGGSCPACDSLNIVLGTR